MDLCDEMIRCQVCQCPHPKGLPKVCLELHQFLEQCFPKEYALRRDAAQLKQINFRHPSLIPPSLIPRISEYLLVSISCSFIIDVHIYLTSTYHVR